MRLSDEEAAVAAYIFGKSFKRESDETDETDETDDTEVLVRAHVHKEIALTSTLKTTHVHEEVALRSGLKTLMLGKLVFREVLDMVVCMLTEEERCRTEWTKYWFLPTRFSIYIPIDVDCHWILLVVDMDKKKLLMLDSLPVSSKTREKMMKLIHKMMLDKSFYDIMTPAIAKISEFEIDIPEEGQQEEDMSNDCRVWVASWMMLHKEEDHYNVKVDAIARLRLALDLVMKSYNSIHNDIISKALKAL
ncbi:hypothetical protein RIF29_09999 [Crotalaria pallida]|uniref:Ubiquitin-like protease family profile domain-containing protein n=1 Tax=Crotalaria pallida TaxID=3830 RepID=A0AAN9FSC3_CROPI